MREQSRFLPKLLPVLFLFLITVHAFMMNGYATMDRYNVISTYFSSIRAQVDPDLFKNSFFIQSLNRANLRISLLFDFVPYILEYVDLEVFAIAQTFVSLFFVIAGIFMLTKTLFGRTEAGYLATMLYTVQLNSWTLGSPAPYLNFFHHSLPYAYPLVVWSMVFFLQKRFPLSLFLSGVSWSFHPMVTLFLLCAFFLYWLLNRREFSIPVLAACIIAFVVPAFPALVKTVHQLGAESGHGPLWLEGVRWVAWYTCFPSEWPGILFVRAGLFFILSALCYACIDNQATKRWLQIFFLSVVLLCAVGTVFADMYPIALIVKLSLWRSTTLYLFLAIACIGYASWQAMQHSPAARLMVVAMIVLLTGYGDFFKLFYLPFLIASLAFVLFEKRLVHMVPLLKGRFSIIFYLSLGLLLGCQAFFDDHVVKTGLFLVSAAAFLLLCQLVTGRAGIKAGLVLVAAFVVLFDCGVLIAQGGPKINFYGNLLGENDPWTDIQLAAKERSATDDLFIVPPYLNDFTKYSLRATLGDWGEGTYIIYLDNRYVQEWFRRMYDLGWRKRHQMREGYNGLTTGDIKRVARKYGALFVVTEKPKQFDLDRLYENERYILYRVP